MAYYLEAQLKHGSGNNSDAYDRCTKSYLFCHISFRIFDLKTVLYGRWYTFQNESSHIIDHFQHTNFWNKKPVMILSRFYGEWLIGCLYANCVLTVIFSGFDRDDWIDGGHLSVTESWTQWIKAVTEIVYGNHDMLSLLRSRIANVKWEFD